MITNWAEYHRNYYYRRRQRLLDYLGGSCVKCGSNENLQFDHINPDDKEYDIKDNLTLSSIQSELDKCQLLCRLCYLKKTTKEIIPFTHGTLYAWMKKKCRCEICIPEWRKFHDARNAKRRKPKL